MKLRLIVMNGHRLLESQRDGKWRIEKVDKANGLTPYIYNLFMAEPADKTQQYDGVVLYADRQFVYQIFRKSFVRHDAADFELAPTYGKRVRIAYMKIAILDFDLIQAESASEILVTIGHDSHPFKSSPELLQRLYRKPYDVQVLNMQHPEEEIELVQAVRKQVPAAVPILCITASANEDEIIASLDAGANDCMFRPIRRMDLVTRVLVLLRRAYPYQTDGEQLHFGSYVFEPRRGHLIIMGKPVEVTRKEFDLALLFFRNIGRLLSRTFILEAVWGGDPPEMSRTMDTHVSRVRLKLGLVSERGFRLASMYGFGYRLDQVNPNHLNGQPSE